MEEGLQGERSLEANFGGRYEDVRDKIQGLVGTARDL